MKCSLTPKFQHLAWTGNRKEQKLKEQCMFNRFRLFAISVERLKGKIVQNQEELERRRHICRWRDLSVGEKNPLFDDSKRKLRTRYNITEPVRSVHICDVRCKHASKSQTNNLKSQENIDISLLKYYLTMSGIQCRKLFPVCELIICDSVRFSSFAPYSSYFGGKYYHCNLSC